MKKSFVFLTGLLILSGLLYGRVPVSDTLRITSTPDLYPLASAWAGEYSSTSPGLAIKVIMASDSKEAEDFINRGMIGLVSARNFQGVISETGWKAVVARDVIVPIISSRNPAIEKISRQGISADMLLRVLSSRSGERWNTIVKEAESAPVNYYRLNDESVAGALTRLSGGGEINMAGSEVNGSEALIAAIRKDPYGIGFCRLTAIIDPENQTLAEGLTLLPIDKNNNGILDYSENIYGDFNKLSRAIWIGKFPRALFSNIYAAGIQQPESEATVAFLKWVLTDGQKFLYDNGYSDLLITERQRAVEDLNKANIYSTAVSKARSPFVVLLFLFMAAVLLVFAADRIIRSMRRVRNLSPAVTPEYGKVFVQSSVEIPRGLYFDKTHTWAFMEKDGMVKIGIDDFLQQITGRITRIKMKKDGSKVQKGEHILSLIQNGKNLDLYAPVSGIIREHNSVLETNSGLINSSPYNEGWVYKMEPSNWQRENQLLFYAEKYKQFLGQEFIRLKDFFSSVLNAGNEKYSYAIMQDGGELHSGILSQMGPEIWEDFQTKYLDPSRQIWFYEMF